MTGKLKFRKNIWISFPEIDLAHDRKIEISKNIWMSFPGYANKLKFDLECLIDIQERRFLKI